MLGGAFNPPHTGHLLLAQEARWALPLDEVLLVTTGVAAHKELADDPGAELRLQMTALAAEAGEELEACGLEVERPGPSYMHETLAQLAELHPGRELWLLLGADMASSLGEWKHPERIVASARIGVVPRPGVGLGAVESTLSRLGAADRSETIQMPLCGVSSTLIRERAAAGRPLRHLVPDSVAALIAERELYR